MRVLNLSLLALLLAGCAGRPLMPTPNLYLDGTVNPFPDVPAELQSNLAKRMSATKYCAILSDSFASLGLWLCAFSLKRINWLKKDS